MNCAVVALFLVTFGIAQPAHAVEVTCEDQFLGGVLPGGTPETDVIVAREDYCIAVNPTHKFADWIAYHLKPEQVTGDAIGDYQLKNDPDLADENVLEKADYVGAYQALRMDRGHLAPLSVFRAVENPDAISYLGNVVPQAVTINRGVWRVLEARERNLALQNADLYVMTGTLYQKPMDSLPNADEDHVVPSGFWKLIKFDDQVQAYAFDQDTEKGSSVDDGLITLEALEAITGYQFSPELEIPEGGEAATV